MGHIYGLFVEPDTIRYVGKTVKSPEARFKQHVVNSGYLNYPVYRWMRKYKGLVSFVVLEEVDDERIDEAEIRWIADLRAKENKLLNCTNGGDGQSGLRLSEASKKLMSDRKKGKPSGRKGSKHTEETRRKISEAVKKARQENPMVFTEQHRANLSKRAKARTPTYNKRGKTKVVTTEILDKIFEMRAEGKSLLIISKEVNLATEYVRRLINGTSLVEMTKPYREELERKLVKEDKPHFNSKLTTDEIVALENDYLVVGLSPVQLAKKYNISQWSVRYNYLKKLEERIED